MSEPHMMTRRPLMMEASSPNMNYPSPNDGCIVTNHASLIINDATTVHAKRLGCPDLDLFLVNLLRPHKLLGRLLLFARHPVVALDDPLGGLGKQCRDASCEQRRGGVLGGGLVNHVAAPLDLCVPVHGVNHVEVPLHLVVRLLGHPDPQVHQQVLVFQVDACLNRRLPQLPVDGHVKSLEPILHAVAEYQGELPQFRLLLGVAVLVQQSEEGPPADGASILAR
mmetsp:Transcript_3808/g.9069  ORF Transcript_3808/g.9069 Transcript_3808/m.9069 type:complete len:224 (-) Transcript_3808:141-812(-)